MHELSIAEEILTTAKSHGGPGRRITRIEVAIGPFSGVVRESLEFCFELAAKHFGMENAKLSIAQLTAEATCPACGNNSRVDNMWTVCAACGHSPLTVKGGRELRVDRLTIEEDEHV